MVTQVVDICIDKQTYYNIYILSY